MIEENRPLLSPRRTVEGELMQNLLNALKVWEQSSAAHTQAEFRRITDLPQSTVNALFNGERALTTRSFPRVFHAFYGSKPEQALAFLKAHMLGQVPDGLEDHVTLEVHDAGGHVMERAGSGDRLDMAFRWIEENYRKDPDIARLVVSLYAVSGGGKGE